MRGFGRSCAVAFALANLYLLFLTGPLVSPQHQLIFHLPGSATVLFVPVIVDLLAAFLVLAAALSVVRRHPRCELFVWAVLLLPLPVILVETVGAFLGQPPNRWLLWATILFAVAGFVFVIAWNGRLMPGFQRVRPALTTILGFVSLSGLVLLGQLLWFAWQSRDLNPPFVARTVTFNADAPPGSPRVIWIILDELSYRQVYGDRYPGLALPNFDRLASESTIFTHADAAAQYTRIAVPALLTGDPLSATSPTADGRHLLLHTRGVRGWHALEPQNTVFGDVVSAGLPTGIAGWYEPYCRVLPSVLDRCFWTYSDNIPGDLLANSTIVGNATRPFRSFVLSSLHLAGIGPGAPSEGSLDVQRHRADYRALLNAGDQLLEQQTAGLLLLHMPLPHPWGFYDRRTGRFPNHRTSYIDNLALADAYVGHVRALLAQNGAWDSSTVIIMGDHGWRTRAVWRHSGFWTDEERRASHGGDMADRPAMIVKLAGQQTPARIDGRYDAVRTRRLIDAILRGQLRTPEQLKSWVEQDGSSASNPGPRF